MSDDDVKVADDQQGGDGIKNRDYWPDEGEQVLPPESVKYRPKMTHPSHHYRESVEVLIWRYSMFLLRLPIPQDDSKNIHQPFSLSVWSLWVEKRTGRKRWVRGLEGLQTMRHWSRTREEIATRQHWFLVTIINYY